jgi:hypothetical protein
MPARMQPDSPVSLNEDRIYTSKATREDALVTATKTLRRALDLLDGVVTLESATDEQLLAAIRSRK